MKKKFILIFVLLIVKSAFSQKDIADLLYDNFEFELASKYYENADSLKQNQLEKHALCYYYNNDFHSSIPLFEKALKLDSNNLYLNFHYSVSLKNVGRYQSAKMILNSIYSSDTNNTLVKLHLNSIDSLMKWDTLQFFKKLAAYDEINTKSSQFAPLFYDEGIYFINEEKKRNNRKRINLISINDTINRKEKKSFNQKMDSTLTYGRIMSPKTYVYKSLIDVTQLFKDFSNPIPKKANDSSYLLAKNEGFNVTSYCTSFDNNDIYYTRHSIINKWNPEKFNNPLLYRGKLNEEKSKIKSRKRLKIKSFPINEGSAEISVSSDGKSIYFASDKPNGFGGSDIYVSHKDSNGKWLKAKNLGPDINTQFDEGSPKIYDDSILFFSSNGWPGYGNADIFKCKILEDSILNFQHLPYPINSNGDDIYFSLHPFDESIGVMSSNRSKGAGGEDIYFAYMVPIEPYVKGYIKHISDSSILENVTVKLFNNDNIEIAQTTTKVNGVYRFSLKMDSTYKIIATKAGMYGFYNIKVNDSLFRHEKKDIFLDSTLTFQGFIVDESNKRVGKCKIDFFDQKDKLVNTIYSGSNGFFQLTVEENEKFLVMAAKREKSGSIKININRNYSTDSITIIKIFNNRPTVQGVIYDTNNKPSNNAIVRLLDSNNNEIERITTKKDGKYHLSMTTLRYYRIIATNYGMTKDSSFFVKSNWNPKEKKNIYLESNSTFQGVSYFKDSVTMVDDVKVEVESGFDNKYISIYSDRKGFFQFPLSNDSLIFVNGFKNTLAGNLTVSIDSNYNTKSFNNIYLHSTLTKANGVVVINNDSTVKNAQVELIDKKGQIVSRTTSDSTGKFYFELKTDSDYEIYCSVGKLEAVENIHTGILWNNEEEIVLNLKEKGIPTYGLIVDSEDKSPLSYVKVTLTDSISNLKNITYSNLNGKFEMSLKKNTTNYLKLEKENYFTKTLIIKIGDVVPKIIDLSKQYNLTLTRSNFHIDPIYFEFDSHEITPHSKIELDKLVQWLLGHKERTCTIYGYTDCRGKQYYNLNLSKKRANTVSDYLVKSGISSKKITTIPRGATNYVNNCYSSEDCTEAEHRENRRCEFEINDLK